MGYHAPWLTMREAAEVLRIEPRTLQYWVKQGRIQQLLISGRGVRFRKEAVLAMVGTDPRPRAGVFGNARM
jgi:excisionase family DNA binding protein